MFWEKRQRIHLAEHVFPFFFLHTSSVSAATLVFPTYIVMPPMMELQRGSLQHR